MSECCLIELLSCILFLKCIHILALEVASTGNQHCANCIGAVRSLFSLASARGRSPIHDCLGGAANAGAEIVGSNVGPGKSRGPDLS